jgi:amidase
MGGKVHPDVLSAFNRTIKILTDLGHEITEDRPKIDGKKLAKSYLTNLCAHISADLEQAKRIVGKSISFEIELLTKTLGLIGRSLTALEFVEMKEYWHELTFETDSFYEKYDIFLTPVTAVPPPLLGTQNLKTMEIVLMNLVNFSGAGRLIIKSGVVEQIAQQSFEKFPFTQISNLTGDPSMSVPLFWTGENLPIGSLFSSKKGKDFLLFQLAFQLEKSSPWFQKKPILS